MADSFLSSKAWQRLRRAVLQRDGYECQFAKSQGRHEPADCVHHIFPRDEYPEYRLLPWNLISLSTSAHNAMHERDSQKLTALGRELMFKTAEEQRLSTQDQTILLIGFPGTGKTTEAKRILKNGLCYDLDAIAGALRLSPPKKDTSKAARWLANDLFKGFVEAAKRYSRRVIVIRTAPDIDDIQSISPTELVICRGGYGNKELADERRHTIAQKIKYAEEYAKQNGIPIKEIYNDY